MNTWIVLFWFCAGLVFYTYFGYPMLLALRGRKKDPGPRRPFSGAVSVVVAAYNEEACLGRRLQELVDQLQSSGLQGEILVISDGSTDRTVDIARGFSSAGVRVVEFPENLGKAAALNEGARQARGEVLVFADVRQNWGPGALSHLLENFADPQIGAVSGELVLESRPGVLAGVGLYWRYEKWLRKKESQVHSQVGVTGAICAVRRDLFRPIPAGTLLDDVYWPLQVSMQGFRVVHEERARAHDRLPDRPGDEFRRKVRTLCGNFQLLARLPQALLPWRNSIWWQWISHKLLRLVVPWALLMMLLACAWQSEGIYTFFFWLQVEGYLFALAGLFRPLGERVRMAAAAASFLLLNAAAWLGFWVWLFGRTGNAWGKVTYSASSSRPSGALQH